jgi:hypothetical protein
MLTTTVGPGLTHFQAFLTHGTAGITDSIYLGVAIPGRFCPNFGYHFQTMNKVWPTPPIAFPSTQASIFSRASPVPMIKGKYCPNQNLSTILAINILPVFYLSMVLVVLTSTWSTEGASSASSFHIID